MKTIPFDTKMLPEALSLEIMGNTLDQAKEVISAIGKLSNVPDYLATTLLEMALQGHLSIEEKFDVFVDTSQNTPNLVLGRHFIGWDLSWDGIIVKLWSKQLQLQSDDCWHITIQFTIGSRLRPSDYAKLFINSPFITRMSFCLPRDMWMTHFPDSPVDTPTKITFTPITTDENSRLACAHLRNEMKRVSEVALNISRSTDTCPADIATDIHNLYQQIGRFLST